MSEVRPSSFASILPPLGDALLSWNPADQIGAAHTYGEARQFAAALPSERPANAVTKSKYESLNYFKDYYGEWERDGVYRTHVLDRMVHQGYELSGIIHDQVNPLWTTPQQPTPKSDHRTPSKSANSHT